MMPHTYIHTQMHTYTHAHHVAHVYFAIDKCRVSHTPATHHIYIHNITTYTYTTSRNVQPSIIAYTTHTHTHVIPCGDTSA